MDLEAAPPPRMAARAIVAEQIALAASDLARKASANSLDKLSALLNQIVLEAWREASEPEPTDDKRTGGDPGD